MPARRAGLPGSHALILAGGAEAAKPGHVLQHTRAGHKEPQTCGLRVGGFLGKQKA
jgi:hypothetical protein